MNGTEIIYITILCYSLLYFGLLVVFWFFWKRPEPALRLPEALPAISLVIPLRNEIQNIPLLLERLEAIPYPNMEVIFVDDHSADSTCFFLEEWLPQLNREAHKIWRLIYAKGSGKKSCFEEGIYHASGDLIVLSAADVIYPKKWFQTLAGYFQDPKVQMVAGPVYCNEEGDFLYQFQQIDRVFITFFTKALWRMGWPLLINGSNISFRASAYEAVGGFYGTLNSLVGEDEFILRKMKKQFGLQSLAYITHPDFMVRVSVKENWHDLLEQRYRWTTKWKVWRDAPHFIFGVGIVFMNVIYMLAFSLMLFDWYGTFIYGYMAIVKLSCELWLLKLLLSHFGLHQSWKIRLNYSFTQPLFVLGIASNFLKERWIWKNRIGN
ncbi:MAG: glycosyltransferase [Bacteroidia bacterium]